ncbi:MAG: DNA glycosylase [Nitrospirota bacterium]
MWRHDPSPYKIMIAEFMLQRTKAEQVEPVYKNFLKRYPDIFKLARAKESKVSCFTNNLGLHKRGKNFIMAAKYIIEHYKGKFPGERAVLLKIPGIGDYVAGAILTVCFKKPEYVIDANIARFINRYYGLNLKGEIRRKKEIIEKAKRLFNYSDTRNLLFAVLDFAALICTARRPEHEQCPLSKSCHYFIQNIK